jgi:hypothetical protein
MECKCNLILPRLKKKASRNCIGLYDVKCISLRIFNFYFKDFLPDEYLTIEKKAIFVKVGAYIPTHGVLSQYFDLSVEIM